MPPHVWSPGGEVDVGPRQLEDLSAPKAEEEGQGVLGVVNGRGVEALGEKHGVQVLDVLGLEASELGLVQRTMWSLTSAVWSASALGRTRRAQGARCSCVPKPRPARR
jgi:hypothetical protein